MIGVRRAGVLFTGQQEAERYGDEEGDLFHDFTVEGFTIKLVDNPDIAGINEQARGFPRNPRRIGA
jgi:hypothetical protein